MAEPPDLRDRGGSAAIEYFHAERTPVRTTKMVQPFSCDGRRALLGKYRPGRRKREPGMAGALRRWPLRDRVRSDPDPMTASHAPTPAIPEGTANPASATMVPAVMGRRAVPVPPAVLGPVRLRTLGKSSNDVVQGRIRKHRRGGRILGGQACRKPGSGCKHRKQKRSSVHNRDTPCSLRIGDTRCESVVRASFAAFAPRVSRQGLRPVMSMLVCAY